MRAELKSLFSMGIGGSLEGYSPADPDNFGIRVMAFIGSAGDDKSDSFDVLACTPRWFMANFDDDHLLGGGRSWEPPGLRFGNRFLFMRSWDYQRLWKAISDLCTTVEAADWGSVANQIGRHVPWEFDYRYDKFLETADPERPHFPPTKNT